jgi:nucleoside 2-deoxyribosyltransferase
MKTIRAVDLRLVDMSDFLIVNLDINTHPCGTLEEIFWANRQKKPIIIHMEQGKNQTPDWLFGTIPHQMFFSTWDEIKQYLVHIDTSENIDTHKRWYFFMV